MASRLVPTLRRAPGRAGRDAGGGFSQGEGATFRLSENTGVAPGRDANRRSSVSAAPLQLPPAHVTHTLQRLLADAQVDKPEERRGQIALFENCVSRQHCCMASGSSIAGFFIRMA